MKKILLPAVLAALCLGSASCRQEAAPRISIFCDHIETAARQEGISFAEAAARFREMGYAGADIRVLQDPAEIRTLDSLGFAHACAITDINYAAGDQTEMEDRTIAFMEEGGYERLLLVPGLMGKESTQEDREAVRQRIAAFAARVTARGFQILVEDYDNPRSLCFNTERLDSLFALSGDLGLVFDTGNFLFAGEEALACFDHFRDRIGHVHLKDRVSPTDMHCVPAGTGCIPMADIVRRLAASGYDGWYTVEQYGSSSMLADSRTAYGNLIKMLE